MTSSRYRTARNRQRMGLAASETHDIHPLLRAASAPNTNAVAELVSVPCHKKHGSSATSEIVPSPTPRLWGSWAWPMLHHLHRCGMVRGRAQPALARGVLERSSQKLLCPRRLRSGRRSGRGCRFCCGSTKVFRFVEGARQRALHNCRPEYTPHLCKARHHNPASPRCLQRESACSPHARAFDQWKRTHLGHEVLRPAAAGLVRLLVRHLRLERLRAHRASRANATK